MFCIWAKENLYWIFPIIITIVLTLISIKILKGQKNHQETQICVDLMEKRLAVLGTLEEVFRSIASNDVSQTTLREFRFKTRSVSYLFGNEVLEYCNNIQKLLKEITYLNAKTDMKRINSGNRVDLSYDKNLERKYLLESEVAVTLENALVDVFKPYMDFSKYKVQK